MAGLLTEDGERLVELREIEPRVRHTVVMQMFGLLGPGEGFRIVSDHDPKRLFFDFQIQFDRGFEWVYLEEGPVSGRSASRARARSEARTSRIERCVDRPEDVEAPPRKVSDFLGGLPHDDVWRSIGCVVPASGHAML